MVRTITYLLTAVALVTAVAVLVFTSGEAPLDNVDDRILTRNVSRAELSASNSEVAAEPTVGRPARTENAVADELASRAEPNILTTITGLSFPDIQSPPWSDVMESAILGYIAQTPGLELADLQVQCGDTACLIYLSGDGFNVYEMDFDVFAREQGFASATIRTIDGGPRRLVYLHVKRDSAPTPAKPLGVGGLTFGQ